MKLRLFLLVYDLTHYVILYCVEIDSCSSEVDELVLVAGMCDGRGSMCLLSQSPGTISQECSKHTRPTHYCWRAWIPFARFMALNIHHTAVADMHVIQ